MDSSSDNFGQIRIFNIPDFLVLVTHWEMNVQISFRLAETEFRFSGNTKLRMRIKFSRFLQEERSAKFSKSIFNK